MLIKLYSK